MDKATRPLTLLSQNKTKLATSLDSLIQERYNQAVSQGSLLFTKSSPTYQHTNSGVDFELRCIPSLAKKPDSKPSEKQRSKHFVNPFLPPDPALFIKRVGHTHNLVLNKYCISPYHLLLTTTDFIQQGVRLDSEDFAAVVEVTSSTSRRHIVFYNSGEESGASQPHKHLQLLPVPEKYPRNPPTVDIWLQDCKDLDGIGQSPSLPFVHFGIRLVAGDTESLVAAYEGLMECIGGSCHSYNIVMTADAMIVFPRSKSKWMGVGVNSLGFAGLLLCKSTEELALVERVGVLGVLAHVGVAEISMANKLI